MIEPPYQTLLTVLLLIVIVGGLVALLALAWWSIYKWDGG